MQKKKCNCLLRIYPHHHHFNSFSKAYIDLFVGLHPSYNDLHRNRNGDNIYRCEDNSVEVKKSRVPFFTNIDLNMY